MKVKELEILLNSRNNKRVKPAFEAIKKELETLDILKKHINIELLPKDELQSPNRMYCSAKTEATSQGIKLGYAKLTDEEFELLKKWKENDK